MTSILVFAAGAAFSANGAELIHSVEELTARRRERPV
jgi:hypothetical protein